MPVIPDVHGVLFFLDVIRPYCWFDEGSGPVVTEMIDGESEFFKIGRSIEIQLIHSDFGNSSSQHVSDLPPTGDN